jgi:23S rRNA (adenine2503-C2)-methyltransferase
MPVSIKNIKIDSYTLPVMIIKLKANNIISIPSQIGCAVNCDFCISKNSKFVRNLKSLELEYLAQSCLDNYSMISFTGEGEPILNIENINSAIKNLDSHKLISDFRICMSGIKADNLNLLEPSSKPIDLQFSLHSPFDETRKSLIQHTKNIDYILENISNNESKFREVSVNYVLMENINDHVRDLEKLIEIIPQNWTIKLNPLLDENEKYKQSKNHDLFYEKLSKVFNVKMFSKIGSTIKNNFYEQLTYDKVNQ